MNISQPAASLPPASPLPSPRSQDSHSAPSPLQVLLDKVTDHIKNEIKSDSAIRDADMQNESRYVEYLNEQRPGLNLHSVESTASMEQRIMDSLRSGASHTRFLVPDQRGRHRFYIECRHPQDGSLTIIAFNHMGFARPENFDLAFLALRKEIESLKGFEEIFFLQVDTYKQAIEFDTVMFAAHSASIALERAGDFEKLHAMALEGTKYIRDEGRRHPGSKPLLFSEAFYEYEQLRDATPGERLKLPGNAMPIFTFRQQLLRGIMAMSHMPA